MLTSAREIHPINLRNNDLNYIAPSFMQQQAVSSGSNVHRRKPINLYFAHRILPPIRPLTPATGFGCDSLFGAHLAAALISFSCKGISHQKSGPCFKGRTFPRRVALLNCSVTDFCFNFAARQCCRFVVRRGDLVNYSRECSSGLRCLVEKNIIKYCSDT